MNFMVNGTLLYLNKSDEMCASFLTIFKYSSPRAIRIKEKSCGLWVLMHSVQPQECTEMISVKAVGGFFKTPYAVDFHSGSAGCLTPRADVDTDEVYTVECEAAALVSEKHNVLDVEYHRCLVLSVSRRPFPNSAGVKSVLRRRPVETLLVAVNQPAPRRDPQTVTTLCFELKSVGLTA